MTREGVHGIEPGATAEWARHNTTLPFTRFLAGPADYTPVLFGDRRKETSWAHQIATAAVFTSPLLVFGGHPQDSSTTRLSDDQACRASGTRRSSCRPEIGELAGLCPPPRRHWFLAVLNGPVALDAADSFWDLG